MTSKKKIVFLTGTRADYGKIKAVIQLLIKKKFKIKIFVTGMHLDKNFGYTYNEIKKSFKEKILYRFSNKDKNNRLDIIIAKTIFGFSKFLEKSKPDLVIIHGDRAEALSGAISASFKGILVGHIEGGEISGNIDEHIRHSVSKLSHLHFVSNRAARNRLVKLGEDKKKIFICGSPDIDVMLSKNLPTLKDLKKKYEIDYSKYGILLFHPETTNIKEIRNNTLTILNSLKKSKKNFIVIYPNNDYGYKEIISIYNNKILNNLNFKIIKSMRFEFFLTLLKNSNFIIGNSSTGIHEAPLYGIPTINIGLRQKNRWKNKSIINVKYNEKTILEKMLKYEKKKFILSKKFGSGQSSKKILDVLNDKQTWQTNKQKQLIY